MVDLTFVGQVNTSQVRRQPPCTGGFACLGSNPSLTHRTKASFKVELARCQTYSCNMRWLLGPFWPRFSHLRWPRKSSKPCTMVSNRSRDSLFNAKTWCKVASHECLSRIGKSLQSTLGIDPAVAEDGLFFCDLAKAPHHTSFSDSVTHAWQTARELSLQPLGGPRDQETKTPILSCRRLG